MYHITKEKYKECKLALVFIHLIHRHKYEIIQNIIIYDTNGLCSNPVYKRELANAKLKMYRVKNVENKKGKERNKSSFGKMRENMARLEEGPCEEISFFSLAS